MENKTNTPENIEAAKKQRTLKRKEKKALEEGEAEDIPHPQDEEEKSVNRTSQPITTTNIEKYAFDEITTSTIAALEKNRRLQALSNIEYPLFSQINMDLYPVLQVMYRQAWMRENPDNKTIPDLLTPEELKIEVNKNQDDFFLMCKTYAPTEESSKDLPEALKNVELILTLGNPASVMAWIHSTNKAIKARTNP